MIYFAYKYPTTCLFLLLTLIQTWGCKTPQTLVPLIRTETMKHGYTEFSHCRCMITMNMGKSVMMNMSNRVIMTVL